MALKWSNWRSTLECWLLQRSGLLLLNVYMSHTCIPRSIMWQVGIKLEVFMSVLCRGIWKCSAQWFTLIQLCIRSWLRWVIFSRTRTLECLYYIVTKSSLKCTYLEEIIKGTSTIQLIFTWIYHQYIVMP